jgi:bifunctional DNA-binding transcriptional regulator/antitoxin component of YhaV-PrlF toxin-antitoxin module
LKKSIKLLFLFILIYSVSHSQITTEKQSLLLRTFGFIEGQKSTLNNIKENFPEQNIEAEIAELEFNKNYGQALSKLNLEVRQLLGIKFKDYVLKLDNEADKYFNSKILSKKEAISFVEKVKNRAKGNIQDPYLEFLKRYAENSINDLSTSYNLHEVKSYFNSRVIELKVKVPKNWKEINGNHPSVLKKFRSDYGVGDEIITIGRIDNQNNIKSFAKKWFLEFLPKGSKLISADTSKTIDNKVIGVLEYEESNSNIGSNHKRIITQYFLPHQNDLLLIHCATYGKNNEDLNIKIKRLKPIYRSILESIDINNHKIEKNHTTYKN